MVATPQQRNCCRSVAKCPHCDNAVPCRMGRTLPRTLKMKTSMYQTSIPTFTRVLNNLVAILEKCSAHAEARKIDPTVLLNARLFPDMFPFTRQIQLAADTAISGAARLAGTDIPAHDN